MYFLLLKHPALLSFAVVVLGPIALLAHAFRVVSRRRVGAGICLLRPAIVVIAGFAHSLSVVLRMLVAAVDYHFCVPVEQGLCSRPAVDSPDPEHRFELLKGTFYFFIAIHELVLREKFH